MPRLGDLYPSKFLTAADLPDEGIIVTVRSIDIEKMRDGTEKPVIYFDEIEKGVALNKTNAKTIAKMYGDDTDQWEDERITLFPTTCDFQGETIDCIRIKPKKPKPAIRVAADRGNGAKKAPDGQHANKPMTQEEADEPDDEDTPF